MRRPRFGTPTSRGGVAHNHLSKARTVLRCEAGAARPREVDWITAREAALIQAASRARVNPLAHRDLLPYVTLDRRLYFHRRQLKVVAHARDVRAGTPVTYHPPN